jgi:LysR family transcriptional regulator, flagellar master operon regulator
MQIELARTFLEVIAAGSFLHAADRLHVTQSTVSARIRLLEEQIGRRLFVRNKDGARLTPAGVQFQRHAEALIRIWAQARQEAAVPAGYRAMLRIGAEAGLWNRMLHEWVSWMRDHARDIALRCEVGAPDALTHNLLEGLFDIVVTYSPESRPGIKVDLIGEEELVLLEAQPQGRTREKDYIYVDWGDEFRRKHRMTFPDFPSPALFIGLGTLGFAQLLRSGGSGYFPRGLALRYLRSGRVREVAGAATFPLPIYASYPSDGAGELLTPALRGLKAIVTATVQRAGKRRSPPPLAPRADVKAITREKSRRGARSRIEDNTSKRGSR